MTHWLVSALTWIVMAQTTLDGPDGDTMGLNRLGRNLIAVVVYSLIGVAILFVCLFVIDKSTAFSFRKEIIDDQNSALAILVGAIMIGISVIIAAAVHG